MLVSYASLKYFLSQATSEKIQFYCLLQFISFVRTYSGKKEIVKDFCLKGVGSPEGILFINTK